MAPDRLDANPSEPPTRPATAAGPFAQLKRFLKKHWRQSRSLVVRRCFSFSVEDLASGLARAGINSGDLVLVHSSWTEFEGFSGKPTDVISALRKAVGPSGTILMPTLPFTGTALEYARTNPVFDVRKTPSTMGLISEIFRRLPETLRSSHPTHSVAAQGPLAADTCTGHDRATTPCAEHSPFAGLAHRDGKILLMGTGIDVLTFYHYVEELIEGQLPKSPFTKESYALKSRLPDGSLIEIETRLFDPAVSRTRRLSKLVAPLKKRGDFVSSVLTAMEVIRSQIRKNGQLPGSFYWDWTPAAVSSCLTGSAQLSIVAYRLAELAEAPRYRSLGDRLADFVKANQVTASDGLGVNGTIAGSFPLFGEYMRGGYPNWATKYYPDASLLQLRAAAPGE